MILLEITDESGVTHYEVLGIAPKALEGLSDKEIVDKIRKAANDAKRPYTLNAKKGDAEAGDRLVRINQAEAVLKKQGEREKYKQDLQSGKSAVLEILRIRPIAPPFFTDRNVRFRIIERLVREIR